MLALVEGFAGYSLPDDLLSGTGLRAAEGHALRPRSFRSYLSYFVFGGPFPGEAIIPRLYSVHVLLLPAILVGPFTVHRPGPAEAHPVSGPAAPTRTSSATRSCRYAAKAGGFFFIVFGVVALMSALVTINPIWASP